MKTSLLTLSVSIIIAITIINPAYGQTTTVQLPTSADSLSSFRILNNAGANRLRVNSDGGFLLGGVYQTGVIPIEGGGSRLMWHPAKSAFRAGFANTTEWDDANTGPFSIATGFMTIASGEIATAMGANTTASSNVSTAIGYNTTASGMVSLAAGSGTAAEGDYSTAMGNNTTASEISSTALGSGTVASGAISLATGSGTEASGSYSTAMGRNTTASGFTSFAAGYGTEASGMYSVAMGNQTVANGNYSFAFGYAVNTNRHTGSFIFGDSTSAVTTPTADNQMIMRFSGGYSLFTNASCTTGVYMNPGGSSWAVVCDRNKKENFESIDGEQVLTKIKEMPITKWNYKGQDPTVKYIGPVAQDFYNAFHLGGTDSLGISTLSIDGVNIAAIQALEKRTARLRTTETELQKANDRISELENRILKLEQIIASKPENNSNNLTSSK